MKIQISGLVNLSAALVLSLGLLSCDPYPRSGMIIKTGPASFMKPLVGISTFVVMFDSLGRVGIEEYGTAYSFDDDVKDSLLYAMDPKVVFDLPAKLHSNEKVVNIEFPIETHKLRYRAYAKLKGGEIKFGELVIVNF
ncbi:hypothetical protein J2Y45_005929 [Dyadobacter sp. BE34]|uniref:DUF1735 domain-containing protein n=1 Tax=Dyadobacter fermentans TaxID=94254 RepID=A0ABU1R5M9_9BACT|nr:MULTISPECIES: hypothetical protein [Dyadobacter]MDR6808717.1 hypothetical protein [Dyadobacter fermentans]MDR7046460.1 hypothetical protein [Dyadobacter sp. BE242]MDR7200773.1 hypothetical protein [Dyadobacter sp. BE34]MDR7218733.1 hypothetical protein [Dyadobacter sp. BE31]MDR7266663.1 hypothetical protein [Dyadobacter sp. BE32]